LSAFALACLIDRFRLSRFQCYIAAQIPGRRRRAEARNQLQIALIDGEKLADLMARFDVGTQVQQTIVIETLDEDFFDG